MVGIIDYGAGNLTSVIRAVEKLGAIYRVASQPDELKLATSLIFPGVGHAASAMERLRQAGWPEFLLQWAHAGKPILGICLGSQILLEFSEEGNTTCLGLIPGSVKRFPDKLGVKIPQIGWNTVDFHDHPVFRGLDPRASYYFVHSYYTEVTYPVHRLGSTEYGMVFTSALGKDNIVAVQFHPEKSGQPGLQLLDQFLRWRP